MNNTNYQQHPDAHAQYQYAHSQYQYADAYPEQHQHHESAGVDFDGNVNYGAEGNFAGIEAFDETVAAPAIPDHRSQTSSHLKVHTVYKKAPGAPKRFKSSYVHFFTNFVEKKKQQLGPDGLPVKLDIGAVSKECSNVWKNLPDQEKKYWEYVMEKEKEEYNKQKDTYQGPWRIATDKVKKKEPGAPKRSPSAFFLFVNQKRMELKSKYPDMPHTEVVKTLGKIWTSLPDEEKAPFREEELELRAQYKIDVDIWKKEVQVRQKAEKEQKVTKKSSTKRSASTMAQGGQVPDYNAGNYAAADNAGPNTERGSNSGKRKKKDPDAPKRSPPAFFLFVNHRRPQLKMQFPDLPHTEIIKMCGHKWEGMSDAEKKPFRDHEENLRHQYHIDVQNYKRKAVTQKEFSNMASINSMPAVGVPVYEQKQLSQQQQLLQQQQHQLQQQQLHQQQQLQQQQQQQLLPQVMSQNYSAGQGVYQAMKYPYFD